MRKTVIIMSLAILALLCLPLLAIAEEPQGYRLVVQVYGENGEPASIDERAQLANLLQMRLDLLNIEAYTHLRQGGLLIIDMFGAVNTAQVSDTLFGASSLKFLAPDGTVLLTEADVMTAEAGINSDAPYDSQWQLNLTFTPEGGEKFYKATATYYGEQIEIVFDGEIIAKPRILTLIKGGEAFIGVHASYEEAAAQAALINKAARPDSMFTIISGTPFDWVKEAAPEAFADVPPDAWYAWAVEICYKYGLMQGYGNGQFKPEQTVTEAEVLTVCTRLQGVFLGYPAKSMGPLLALSIKDDMLDSPCTRKGLTDYLAESLHGTEFMVLNEAPIIPDNDTELVKHLYQSGILTGVDEAGSFAGDKTLTRAELAVIVARALTL